MALMQPKLRSLIKNCHPEFFTDGPARAVFKFLQEHPGFEIKGELDVQSLHLVALQGADEKRTEAYMQYGEGASQPATRQSAKNLGRQAGSAGQRGEMVQILQDYVKILLLQFEELYADLPVYELEEQAQKLKHRLIDRYVKMQNQKITKAIEAAKTEEQRLELMKKVKKLNELIK
jgi:hypothetical protein